MIGGGSAGFELGRLWIEFVEFDEVDGQEDPDVRVVLPRTPVIAKLLKRPTDLTRYYPIVLGLHAGVLSGRRLTRLPTPTRAAEDDEDCGPRYGQQWYLENGS